MSEKKSSKKTMILLLSIVAAVALAVILSVGVVLQASQESKPKQIITVTSKLEKILEISDLETAQIFYNAVATKQEAGESVRYYAAYEGIIKAGIDFSKIEITSDEETNTISVNLPQAKILELSVNPGTIEYIFLDKKAETETVAEEAYHLCRADLKTRSEEDKERLLDDAYENARNAIEGLIKPWLDQLEETYTLIIK